MEAGGEVRARARVIDFSRVFIRAVDFSIEASLSWPHDQRYSTEAARRGVVRSRRAQGLPDQVQDFTRLSRLAEVCRG